MDKQNIIMVAVAVAAILLAYVLYSRAFSPTFSSESCQAELHDIGMNNIRYCRDHHIGSMNDCNNQTIFLTVYSKLFETFPGPCELVDLQKYLLSIFPFKLASAGSAFSFSGETYMVLSMPSNNNHHEKLRYNGPFDYNSITNWLSGVAKTQI